ncbi:hypothetical protein EMPG_10972 [Blastomyces silverae]|uniref:Uncharacterized protein n=1 Tax=Blastomyces silverae TaxID=2060906 RepID=A0A0H1B2I2_9EURO|nr:hypothetical protein EMPG_10972 [Blastomyces silverae]
MAAKPFTAKLLPWPELLSRRSHKLNAANASRAHKRLTLDRSTILESSVGSNKRQRNRYLRGLAKSQYAKADLRQLRSCERRDRPANAALESNRHLDIL